jgi:hypothetical protein
MICWPSFANLLRIEHPKVRRAIVALVEQIVAEPAERIAE